MRATLARRGLRVFVGPLPQTARLTGGPVITYTIPDRPFSHHLLGSDGGSQAQVEVSVWAYSEGNADQIGQAIRLDLQSYQDDFVMAAILQDETDIPHPPAAGSDQWLYEIQYTYQVNHRVSIPSNLGV